MARSIAGTGRGWLFLPAILLSALLLPACGNDKTGPVSATGDTVNLAEDTTHVGTLTGATTGTDPITFSISVPAENGTATVTDVNTGAYTYVPDADFDGSDSFVFEVTDGTHTATASVAIVMIPADDPPVATTTAVTAILDRYGSGALKADDPDTGDTLTFAATVDPVNGTLTVDPDGSYLYTPDPGYLGPDSFTYQVTDSTALSDTSVVTVTVTEERVYLISVNPSDAAGDGQSRNPSVSADGGFVAFESSAGDLVAGDTNFQFDVFVRDTAMGTTTRVSVATDGSQADKNSMSPAISADGRYVAFHSHAENLVPGDTNEAFDVFLHDTATGTTTRVSVATGGGQSNGSSGVPSISANGRYVAFHSLADNLVAGDTNGDWDVFVHDTLTGTTTRVSVATGGIEAVGGPSARPVISADGRYVAFDSRATNLDGLDTNGPPADVFVHDRWTGTTTRAAVNTGGTANGDRTAIAPAISADGQYVAFWSDSTNLVTPGDSDEVYDVFIRDTVGDVTTRIAADQAAPNAGETTLSFSADGRFLVFESDSATLVGGDTNGLGDVFLHDTMSATTTRISTDTGGTEGNSESSYPELSADGHFVAFRSWASNLVLDDDNSNPDVFLTENASPFNPALDDDGDGLSNGDELLIHFTHYFKADTDGDGFDDGTEVGAMTDPLDPLDHP